MNKPVLFSGIPCQDAGLKSFLIKEYDNLFLIDVICYGVPNARMFQDYLKLRSKGNEVSYYSNFLNLLTLRENCYLCKYACNRRPGDINIGDYWGIEKEHPEILNSYGGLIDERMGGSVVIVNIEKGDQLISNYDNLQMYISD